MGLTATHIIDTARPFLRQGTPLRGETMRPSEQTVELRVSPALPQPRFGSVTSAAGLASRLVCKFLEWFGSLGVFSWQVLKAAVTPPYEWQELIRQLDEVGSKSLPLVVMAGAAIGVIISLGL